MTDISRVLFDLRHFSDLCPMCCMQQNEANQSFSNAFGRKTKTLEVCFWNPWIQTEVSKRLPSLSKAKSFWAWWHLFSNLALRMLKQENKELEATLGNIVKTLSQTKTMNNKANSIRPLDSLQYQLLGILPRSRTTCHTNQELWSTYRMQYCLTQATILGS